MKLRLRVWFASRFTFALLAIAALTFCGAFFPALLWIAAGAAIALGAALVADIAAGPALKEIDVERLESPPFAQQVPATLRYRVANRSAITIRVGLFEEPVAELEYLDDVSVVAPAAGASVDAARALVPLERGNVRLERLYGWYENAWGLLRRRFVLDRPLALRVFPDLSQVERFGKLHARNRTIDAGLRRLRTRGIGAEFESLRDWVPGDAFRSIDWKATARRGKLIVADFEAERNQHVILMLDCGRLMSAHAGQLRKLDYAVAAALSLTSIASLSDDKIGLLAFANSVIAAAPPRPARAAVAELAEMLYDVPARFEESDYERAFSWVRTRAQKRSLIVIFTDMFDPVASGALLSALRTLTARHLVLCVFMNDAAVENALASASESAEHAYRAAVATGLAEERAQTSATLRGFGALVLDVPAERLVTSLVDRYLDIKRRGQL
ncbi:MAG: DUF58 domain-containing protein [Candidatus Eremiobacteraeota bacterium]|nr:DUF58 domain-containing protein [Candidatus Eremiobacteraeota bacterium]